MESFVTMIEGDEKASLRSKFRTGSLAVLDVETIRTVLMRAPLRFAGYSGMRLLQRSAAVTSVDVSSNPEAVNLAKQVANPRYFPRVRALRMRGVTLARDTGTALLELLPPRLELLDVSNARLPSRLSLEPLGAATVSGLRVLALGGTGLSLGASSHHLPASLRCLDASGCRAVRLAAVVGKCRMLRTLRLAFASVTVDSAPGEAPSPAPASGGGWGQPTGRRSRRAGDPGASIARGGAWRAVEREASSSATREAGPGRGLRGSVVADGSQGSALGDAGMAAVVLGAAGPSLRVLDLRGCELSGPEPLLRLATAIGGTIQVLDLRQAVLKPGAVAEHCFRALWPCAPSLVGFGVPAGLSVSFTLEQLLRSLRPFGGLRWIAATVASLHTGGLPRERAMAASAGVSDPRTGLVANAGLSSDSTSSLAAPWCSIVALDVTIASWSGSTAAEDEPTRTEAAADAAGAARPVAGSRTIQDIGPVLAALPQLTRLRVAGSGAPGTRGRLVWARGLTQYARVLASGWRAIGESLSAGSRVPSLRRETSVATLRQALASSPLAELCVEGAPGVHPRVLLLAGALPRLAHLRLQPARSGAGSSLASALSADDALTAVRQQATLRRPVPGSGAGSRAARFESSSGEESDAEDRAGRPVSRPSLVGWPAAAAWGSLARVMAPPRTRAGAEPRPDALLFRCPPRSELPRSEGLDGEGAAAASEEAEARWLQATRGSADDGLRRHRDESRAGGDSGTAAPSGPEEEDSDDDAPGPSAGVDHRAAMASMHAIAGPSVSDLWAPSDDSSDDDADASAAFLPALAEAGTGGEDADDDDEDFGAFGARALAQAASASSSSRRSRRRRRVSPDSSPEKGGGPGESRAGGPAEPSDSAPTPVRVLGFPCLRQLSVAGWATLDARFGAAVARLAPPSLRRVDCRGSGMSPDDADELAAAVSRRERAAFDAWVRTAAGDATVRWGDDGDDLSAVLPGGVVSAWGRSSALGTGHDEALAWSLSAPSDREDAAEAAMRVDAEAESWVFREGDAEDEGGEAGGAATRTWDSEDDALAAASPPLPARPTACATAVTVAAGPWTMHMQGAAAVDALESRGVMSPCQLDCVVDAIAEVLG